jgi:Ran GTPase-activating protein (RanGAP) involved in mRNA processing and transport
MITLPQAINELYSAKIADSSLAGAENDFMEFVRQIQSGLRKDTLDLSRMQFGSGVLGRISRFIRLTPNVIRLHFYGNLIRDTGIAKICQILELNSDIQYLDLGCNDLGERSIRCLTDIVHDSNVISLQLGSLDTMYHPNRLSRGVLSKLLEEIGSRNRIRALGLAGIPSMQQRKTQSYREFSKSLANYLIRSTVLEVLDVANAGFGDGDQTKLTNGFSLNENLRRLDIHGNCFRNGGARLMEGIVLLRRLAFLDVSSCLINESGVAVLGEQLKSGWQLVQLEMSHNPIGSAGITGLLNVLETNIYLTTLNITDTQCDGSIGVALRSCIASNEILQHLNLSMNNFCDTIADVFEDAKLRSLDVSGCRLGDFTAVTICRTLAKSQTLECLRLADNFFSRAVGYEMVDLLQQSESIVWIDVTSNLIDQFAIEALNVICSRNKSTSHRQLLNEMRKQYIHLSIQNSKIPEVTARLESYKHEYSDLLDEIAELRSEIEQLEIQTGVALRSGDKASLEFRTMMMNEEKLITDMQQKRRDVEAEFESSIKEVEVKCQLERAESAKSEQEALTMEHLTADYLRDCEETQKRLKEEIVKCEQLLNEVTMVSRNRKRLREYEIPPYPYEEEEARMAAEKEELLKQQNAAALARDMGLFGDLGMTLDDGLLEEKDAAYKKTEKKSKPKKRKKPAPKKKPGPKNGPLPDDTEAASDT